MGVWGGQFKANQRASGGGEGWPGAHKAKKEAAPSGPGRSRTVLGAGAAPFRIRLRPSPKSGKPGVPSPSTLQGSLQADTSVARGARPPVCRPTSRIGCPLRPALRLAVAPSASVALGTRLRLPFALPWSGCPSHGRGWKPTGRSTMDQRSVRCALRFRTPCGAFRGRRLVLRSSPLERNFVRDRRGWQTLRYALEINHLLIPIIHRAVFGYPNRRRIDLSFAGNCGLVRAVQAKNPIKKSGRKWSDLTVTLPTPTVGAAIARVGST